MDCDLSLHHYFNFLKQTKAVMKNKVIFWILALTGICVLSQCQKVDVAKEEEKIKEVWYKISEYGPKGDWESYKKYMDQSEKIQVIHPGMGEWLKGWEEVSSKYKALLESGNTWIEHKNELFNVNISQGGDMAWANAIYAFSFESNPDQIHHMWESVVFEKIDGDWKFVMVMAAAVSGEKEG